MSQQDEVISRWSSAAPFWEKHHEIIREMFGPVSEALIEDAGVVSGSSVLDVATGPGEPALRIAEVVGPAGEVVGADPAVAVIETARRMASQRSLKNVRFEVAGADSLPFRDDYFDAVISRFGVMFFPSPVNGIREMLRVLKPGRTISFAVWHYLDNNPFHYCLARIVDRFAPEPELPPDAPNAFRFAAPGKLRSIVGEAGARDVSERLFRFSINAPLTVEDFWNLRCDMAAKLRQRLAALPTAALIELKKQALDAFRSYMKGAGVSFPAEVLIVSGRKEPLLAVEILAGLSLP
ncbi:MAG TPA: methyltransferase domain-containing protein [Dehalococcoidia bacterium]|nr:methyltransferase domain-containing protein [Dehalococcoidia bacterium]